MTKLAPLILLCFASCGSVNVDDAGDARAALDAAPCPAGTVPISSDPDSACIERIERGTAEWDAANTTCLGIGRRMCTDEEWGAACTDGVGLENMTNDDDGMSLEWEWVGAEAGGVAHTRGYAACDDASDDAIDQPRDYRCCADR